MKLNKTLKKAFTAVAAVAISAFTVSCDFEYDLPEAGSQPDLTPPSANFEAKMSDSDFLKWDFSNFSNSATDYFWDFGDGNTSTAIDPSNTFPDEGEFTVTLTASDKLGKEDTYSMVVVVEEPPAPPAIIPVINEAGFEDGDDSCGTKMDGRDCWRLSGATIHGISSDEYSGEQSAKYDANDSGRASYQATTCTPNTEYEISVYYSMKDNNPGGEVYLHVLNQAVEHYDDIYSLPLDDDIFLGTGVGDIQEGSKTYNKITLKFNSGDTNTIAIWMRSNHVAEARVDQVEIKLVE